MTRRRMLGSVAGLAIGAYVNRFAAHAQDRPVVPGRASVLLETVLAMDQTTEAP